MRMTAVARAISGRIVPGLTAVFCVTAAALLVALVCSMCVPYGRAQRFEDKGPDAVGPLFPGQRQQAEKVNPEVFSRKRLFDGSGEISDTGNAVSMASSALVLRGVSFGEKKMAVIRDSAGKDYYVSEGESAAGFQVKTIEREKVILQSGGKTLELVK